MTKQKQVFLEISQDEYESLIEMALKEYRTRKNLISVIIKNEIKKYEGDKNGYILRIKEKSN